MEPVVAQMIESDIAVLRSYFHRAVLAQLGEERGRIIRHSGSGRRQRRMKRDGHALVRSPNSAVPTRTQVEPSSMAVSRSFDMPIEICASPCWEANSRSLRKYG